MQRYYNNVLDLTTNAPIPLATVTVYITGTTTKATLYSDNGTTEIPNPVTCDAAGRYFFYVANGVYDLLNQATGYQPYTIYAEQIVDLYSPSATDAPLNIQGLNATQFGNDSQGTGNFSTLQVGGGVIIPSSSNIVLRLTTITTTAATSDAVAIQGLLSSSHVYWVPLNATAAAMTGLELTPSTNLVTLTHPVTAGGIFDIYGSFA